MIAVQSGKTISEKTAIEWFSFSKQGGITLAPLSVWSLRRVLLAGESSDMLLSIQEQLQALGARPLHLPNCLCQESLCRTLHEGRYACIIVPDVLSIGDAHTRLDALNTLLLEAREAGVPLVILLGGCSAQPDGEIAALFSHASGWAHGACGDPVSVQCLFYADQAMHRACREALLLGAQFLSENSFFPSGDNIKAGRSPL